MSSPADSTSAAQTADERNALHNQTSSFLKRTLIALLLVLPVLVAAAFMWAMWDPKTYLKDIPLAVVTEDEGVGEGKDFSNYGEKIAEGMLELDYLNFHKMSKQEAQAKLDRGQLMMVVNIPKDFSAKAATIIDDQPMKPTITFDLNDFYGTQSAFITGSLIPELQSSVAQAVSEEYATEVVAGLNDLSDGLREASDGAKQLDDGAGQLQAGGKEAVAGIAQLKDGSTQLRDGTGQLASGTGELKDGTVQLRDGAGQLADGMDELRDGTGQLADGAGQIKDGVKELTDMLIPLLSQAQGPSQDLRPAVNALRSIGMVDEAKELAGLIDDLDPNNPQNLVTQLGALRDGTAELHYNLSDPSAPYLSGVLQLQDGARQLRDGTVELDSGATQLDDGARQLNDGTKQLDDGMTELSTGGAQLKDGMDQLKDGTAQLSTGLSDGVERAPSIKQPKISSANMANPIAFEQTNSNPVQTSISDDDPTLTKITSGVAILLVILFAFLLMAVLALITPVVVTRRGVDTTTVRGNVLAYISLTAASAVIVALLALAASSRGWQPANWGVAVLVLLLIAGAGTAVFHFLRTAFGLFAGGALIVGVFVLGLFASGAIWPADATPLPLRALHFLHPMGYARDAFVRMSEGIYDGTFAGGVVGLLLCVVISLAVSAFITRRRAAGSLSHS